jgi:Tfp pilus assembly protein PilW
MLIAEIVLAVTFAIVLGGLLLMAINKMILRSEQEEALNNQMELLEESERVVEIVAEVLAEHVKEYHKEK